MGMAPLPAVHPLQPRFAQAITGVLALEAAIFDQPAALAVALALVLLSLLGPRWSPVAWVFRRIAPPATDLEPAAPVRFSQALAAVFLTTSLVLVLAGAELAGWIVAGLLAAVALFSAISGFCVGCSARLTRTTSRPSAARSTSRATGSQRAQPGAVSTTSHGPAPGRPRSVRRSPPPPPRRARTSR